MLQSRSKMPQEQKVDGPAHQYNVQKLSRTFNYFPSVLYSCPLLCTSLDCTCVCRREGTIDGVPKAPPVWRLEVNFD